uniref:DNA polymerase subunit beta n=1 Tax=Fervidicoccus fontis TaxID=683846 RepID=A0A7J3SMB1_9CREN
MVKEKITRYTDERIITYTKKELEILQTKRDQAKRIMNILKKSGLNSILHGSLARGDVHEKSDIDIALLNPVPSYMVEIALEKLGEKIFERRIVQATPASTPKGYIILDPEELMVVSFPLSKLQTREQEFYKFGGLLTLEDLEKDRRVPGVNKRLELIVPVDFGYKISSIIGRESEVASLLDISIETVMERIRVLSRRDEVGRTGVYIYKILEPGESFEQKLKEIMERNPAVRRTLMGR